MLILSLFSFLWLAQLVVTYKIVLFVPNIAPSQVIFNVRIAEQLAAAHHDVTLVLLKMMKFSKEKPLETNITVVPWEASSMNWEEDHDPSLNFRELSISEARQMMATKLSIFPNSCEKMLKNKEFIARLKKEKFDVAFVPMFDMCTAGVVKHIGIDSWIMLNTGRIMDFVAYYIGLPSPPSYVPPMMSDLPEKMTFIQRVKSFLGWAVIIPVYYKSVVAPENELFQKYVDPRFPNLEDIYKMCPLVMVNSDEMYDQARPTLHKIINIGGVGMKHGAGKPLQGEAKKIVDKASNVVVMTMGSHTKLNAMPDEWKTAFMNAFRKFPDHDFILRYEADDLLKTKPANVHFMKWIPQNDLMQHPKTRLLITHGGYNSIEEAVHAGKPLITMPLFGDQFTNGHLMEGQGLGRILRKTGITEESITEILTDVLKDPRYSKNAQRMQRMLEKKPDRGEERLVKWTEFLAEFKTLDDLTPQAVHLSWIQYHSIDVIAFLSICLLTVAFVFFAIVKLIARLLMGLCLGKKKTE